MRKWIVATGCLTLMACGESGSEAVDIAGDDDAIAAALADAPRPLAGQWEVTAKVIDVQMPGMPDNMKRMMMDAMGQRPTFNYCLTKEQAEGDPATLWKETNGDCEYESLSIANGKVDAVAVCRDQGAQMRMTMSGTHTETSYRTRNEMQMSTGQGDGLMIVEAEGRRIGDCDS